VILTGH